jgi:SEC-C motif-containing protein
MRSRYSAFARGLGEYLAASQATPSTPESSAELSRWATSVTWLGLEVRSREAGGAGDDTGQVEFVARYLEDANVVALHERSAFERRDGRWLYVEGKPQVTTTKVERNAPCPCGSGKKFKQCHA